MNTSLARPTTASVLAAVLVGGLLLCLLGLFLLPAPEANRDHLGLVLGALVGAVSTVVGFYFGSSKGSRAKDATFDALLDKAGGEQG